MTSARPWPIALTLAASASACIWQDYDAVTGPDAVPDVVSPDSATATDAPDTSDVADVSVATDATSDASLGVDATPSSACSVSSTPLQSWTFDSTTQSWGSYTDTGVTANLTWTGALGDPSPGALSFVVTPGDGSSQGAWIRYAGSLGDLTGRTVAAWVFLDNGASPHLKVFAQTGSSYAWGDGGTLSLPTGQWTCVSLTLSSPAYNQPGYDPSNVISIGFETLAVDSFELYVDSVRID
jgi:hypothetical protein